MAEIQVQSQLTVIKDKIDYISRPASFTASFVGTAKGPVIGAIDVTLAGVNLDFSEITTPGVYRVINLSTTNTIHMGVWDGTKFLPFRELKAGETYVDRFSSVYNVGYGTGTSTTDTGNLIRLKMITAVTAVALVELFEA